MIGRSEKEEPTYGPPNQYWQDTYIQDKQHENKTTLLHKGIEAIQNIENYNKGIHPDVTM